MEPTHIKPILDPENWLNRYGDYLLSFGMLRVSDKQLAEDLVQETLVSAWKARESFKGGSSEITWLVSILRNKITDHYRKKDVLKDTANYLVKTENEFNDNFFDRSSGHWLNASAPKIWSEASDAGIERAEFDTALRNCIEKMPPRFVPVFVARFFEDEDAETICKAHGISSSNYWVIIHRAKVMMRACLEKTWF